MKRTGVGILFLFYYTNFVLCQNDMENDLVTNEYILEPQNFVNWPRGNIPFFINPEHFDNEQTLIIMTSLSLVAFKTCLKFAPVMVPPADNEHVLTFENPRGTHKCEIQLHGHPKTEPHVVTLGYDCLEAPWMDRIVLRALGLPFEHNRQSRDSYIDVQYENIEQHVIPLFTKDIALPAALRALPYDINSVMHFGDRDYSKNGHRTIIFKDRDVKQRWNGPSDLDLRKIEIIYGAECRERDRQEKIELCHMYPGVPLTDRKRRKRSVDFETTRSLRVNPDITPPPLQTDNTSKLNESLKNLDIEEEAIKMVEDVYKLTNKALTTVKEKYCNTSNDGLFQTTVKVTDINGIIKRATAYAQEMIEHAVKNITSFCAESDSIEKYQRQCKHCQKPFPSTKHGALYPSTKHPFIPQSTTHEGGPPKVQFYPQYNLRVDDGNAKPQNETKGARRKRQAVGTAIRTQVEKLTKSDPEKPVKDTKANRENKKTLKGKRKQFRRRQSDESESDEQSSEESGEKKRRPAFKESENREDSESSRDKLKPKNTGRDGKKNRKPVEQYSGSEDTISTDTEDSNERNGNKKRPTNIATESDEIEYAPKHIKRSPGKVVVLSKENEEFYNQRKWPHGVVRYLINHTCTNFDIQDLRHRLNRVNESLTTHTCTYIEEITEEEATKFKDYLVIDNSPDFVTGRVGGRQIFGTPELLKGGQHRQHAAMMVMAMLGFYFELSRHDRDNYVKVHPRHIRADKLHHFEKIGADATMPLPYDYESATHPPWMFWRKLGKRGISSVATYKDKDPDGTIMKSLGQNSRLLSPTDITKINSVYGVQCMIDKTINEPNSEWEDDQ